MPPGVEPRVRIIYVAAVTVRCRLAALMPPAAYKLRHPEMGKSQDAAIARKWAKKP